DDRHAGVWRLGARQGRAGQIRLHRGAGACRRPRAARQDRWSAAMNPVRALAEHGQAVWLDFLSREFIQGGDFEKLIREDGLTGVTSNPSIFERAIGSSDSYDPALRTAIAGGDQDVMTLYEQLAIADIQAAADALRPVYDRTGGADGFVSMEVSPYLAMDTAGTIEEARRLWREVGRDNLMVK